MQPEVDPDVAPEVKKAAQLLGRRGGLIGGRAKTQKKADAVRENGKLGGRPRLKSQKTKNNA